MAGMAAQVRCAPLPPCGGRWPAKPVGRGESSEARRLPRSGRQHRLASLGHPSSVMLCMTPSPARGEGGVWDLRHEQDHHRRQGARPSAGIYAAAGLRGGGRRDSALLLSRAPVDRRQLPDVPRRGEGRAAEADRLLRDGGARSAPRPEGRAAGGRDQLADGRQGAPRRDGVPADQSSARLPDLRPGRRMRSAGSGDGLRRRFLALSREQARRRKQIHRARWSRPR